jgi:hypothetical protein
MHLISLVAQLVSDAERLQHQYEFLSYGLTAAWIILVVYVLMMVARERKLKREIASLKAMLEDKSWFTGHPDSQIAQGAVSPQGQGQIPMGISIILAVITAVLFQTGNAKAAWVIIIVGGVILGLVLGGRKLKQDK